MSGVRATCRVVGALLVVGTTAVACSGGDGDGGGVSATLPPIATTTTLPPPTTLNLLDQDRFVTVRQGDILSEIAKRYEVSQDDLMEKNAITDPDAVYVGQVLELPEDAVLPDTGPASLVTTTAAP